MSSKPGVASALSSAAVASNASSCCACAALAALRPGCAPPLLGSPGPGRALLAAGSTTSTLLATLLASWLICSLA
jgi:hypothetical protein